MSTGRVGHGTATVGSKANPQPPIVAAKGEAVAEVSDTQSPEYIEIIQAYNAEHYTGTFIITAEWNEEDGIID